MDYVVVAGRALLALVFAASFVSKARNREAFEGFVIPLRKLGLLPRRAARPVAVLVLAAEAATVVLLTVPATVPVGFGLAAALLAVFIVGITVSVRRGTSVPCPCFGAPAAPLGVRHVVRNGLLLGAAVVGGLGTMSDGLGGLHPAGIALSLAIAAVLALLAVRFDEVVELWS